MNGWLVYDRIGADRNGWFISKLLESAGKAGVRLTFLLKERLVYGVEGGLSFFLYDGEQLEVPDLAIVRTIDPLLSRTLENSGARVFNSADVSEICNDKRKTLAFFSARGVPTARSYFENAQTLDPRAYTYPLVMKSPDGHGGREVFLLRNAEDAASAAHLIGSDGLLLQELQTPGLDVRVYLLNGRVLAAVKRTSSADFRSNYSLGGKAELCEPDEDMARIVETVNEALHPTFVGVDFIFDPSGRPLLNEIEDIVGSRMLYALTDLSVHDLLFSAIAESIGKDT